MKGAHVVFGPGGMRPPGGSRAGRVATAVVLLAVAIGLPRPASAQDESEVLGPREAAERFTHVPLTFEQPEVVTHDVDGVPVLLLPDRSLPLVTVALYIRGGYGLFDRRYYAAAMGLPALLRYGGSGARSPAEVDAQLERLALQVSFGSAGGSLTSSVNTLTEHLPAALELWVDMLTRPRFDTAEVAAWRARELESVRRRVDDPTRLAYSEINRLLFGEHPIGWEMDPTDLEADRLAPDTFHMLHRRIVCRENMTVGVTGDAEWSDVEDLVSDFLSRVPACSEPLPEAPVPRIRRAPGVFLIEKELAQSVVVMAHPTNVRLADDPEYYSAMIGNSILGGGGFSSRMLGRVRTEEGYAYSAQSLWTTPRRHEGIVGATTRTRPENTVPAIRLMLATMQELRDEPPTAEEVETTVDRLVNGFVFNFDAPSRVLSRTMYYLAQELPADWLELYLDGVQQVTPEAIRTVFAEHLRPEEMTILVVGDPALIGDDLAELGPVEIIEVR